MNRMAQTTTRAFGWCENPLSHPPSAGVLSRISMARRGRERTLGPAASVLITLLVLSMATAVAEDFDLSWHTIDGGGGTATGGKLELFGTIGQPDVGAVMTGGTFELVGGFWAAGIVCCGGDLDGDCDSDLADVDILLADFGCVAPGPCVGDLDGDGDTDLADLGILLADFGCTP